MSETRLENKAGLSFSLRRGRLLVYHATIQMLGEPSYIRFLLNAKDRKLAVQCCEEIDGNNFRVPENIQGVEYKFEISSVTFLSLIYKNCRWDDTKTYACYGIYHPKYRLVDFNLAEAKEIKPEQFVDPENL